MRNRRGSVRVSIVGSGRVASALALLFKSKGIPVVSVISRRKVFARRLASLIGCRLASDRLSDIHPDTNFLLLAVPDDVIVSLAKEISLLTTLDFPHLYCAHTSGIQTSNDLAALAKRKVIVFSLHPMLSFPANLTRREQLEALKNVSYGVEGSLNATRFANRLIHRLGGNMFRIPKEAKILYHTACVFASNYEVALLGVVESLVRTISKTAPLAHFRKLTESSIANAYRKTPAKAITGPAVRGDLRTVRHHRRELAHTKKKLVNLYTMLGRVALELAVRDKRITRAQAKKMQSIFS